MSKQAVIFVFYDSITNKVLSEQRLPTHPYFPNQITFPGGTIEDHEIKQKELALLREIKEELGVIPKQYIQLKGKEQLIGDKGGELLYPYLIISWEGKIPNSVIDKGNKLIWETLEEAAASPIKTRGKIVNLIRSYLSSQTVSFNNNR